MQVTGNFSDFYGTTMLPALRKIVDDSYKQYPPQFQRIFDVQSSTRSIEQFTGLSGVGRFSAIGEGQAVRRDQSVQGFNKTFSHTRYGLAIPTTIDVVEDDKWNLIGKNHRDLAWSCSETQELQAAAIFNNGFSASAPYTGPDSVALFSASHPLYKAGGLQSNLGTAADLDMSSLQVALTNLETMKRPSGEMIHWRSGKLVTAPANRFLAYALTKSGDDPSTSDRSVNPLKGAQDGMPEPFVWRYLTDPDAWFLVNEPSQTGLVWFWRKRPYTKSWTDDDTEVGVFAMRYKMSVGFNDYIGVYGNAGA